MDSDRKKSAPSEITIKPSMNKGFIVRHSFDNSGAGMSYRQPQEHAFQDHKAMMAHVHKHTSGGTAPTGVGKTSKVAPPTAKTRGAGVD